MHRDTTVGQAVPPKILTAAVASCCLDHCQSKGSLYPENVICPAQTAPPAAGDKGGDAKAWVTGSRMTQKRTVVCSRYVRYELKVPSADARAVGVRMAVDCESELTDIGKQARQPLQIVSKEQIRAGKVNPIGKRCRLGLPSALLFPAQWRLS